jgi:phosphoribosylaminoimidazole-succinocarboxamide synthase
VPLPEGLTEAAKLPEPIFTPTTKADLGQHDEAMTFDAVVAAVGADLAQRLRATTLLVYRRAAGHAASRGVLLADTKFEFGQTADGTLVLADEVLTPDSSRYWPAGGYTPGRTQPAFDKQYVRDWLTSPESGWDRAGGAPPPPLPPDVVASTRARYVEAYERITGRSFADWG